jgi:ribosome-binding protein aMBF1 (putative translation factor)
LRNQKQAKPLPDSIKTLGDWIRVKRQEKNLTSSHLAAKMGIASALVRSWELDRVLPTEVQLQVLADFLRLDSTRQKD